MPLAYPTGPSPSTGPAARTPSSSTSATSARCGWRAPTPSTGCRPPCPTTCAKVGPGPGPVHPPARRRRRFGGRRHHRLVGVDDDASTSCPTPPTPTGCVAAIGGEDTTGDPVPSSPSRAPTPAPAWPPSLPRRPRCPRFGVTPFAWDGVPAWPPAPATPARTASSAPCPPTRPTPSGTALLATGIQPGRAGRTRHPAPRGGPAAPRPRARPGHHPAAGRPGLGGRLGQGATSGAGTPWRPSGPGVRPAAWSGLATDGSPAPPRAVRPCRRRTGPGRAR